MRRQYRRAAIAATQEIQLKEPAWRKNNRAARLPADLPANLPTDWPDGRAV